MGELKKALLRGVYQKIDFSEVKLILYFEKLAKKKEKSLRECYINQFGQPLSWIKNIFLLSLKIF
jgi:hypothetical protein